MAVEIYKKLCAIASQNPHLLQSYKDDLHIVDKENLEKVESDREFVWMLRKSGTLLYSTPSTKPFSATDTLPDHINSLYQTLENFLFWEEYGRHHGLVFAHIKVTRKKYGEVRTVGTEEAIQLLDPENFAQKEAWSLGYLTVLRRDYDRQES